MQLPIFWHTYLFLFLSVQLFSCVQLFVTPWIAAHQLPELARTHAHRVSDAIQPSYPLLSPSPAIFPSIRVFSNESVLFL